MNLAAEVYAHKKTVAVSVVTLMVCIVTLLALQGPMRGILSTSFLPHAYCYLNNKELIALHFVSDTAIWLSYVGISITLAYLVHRTRREIPFSWMFLAFGTFIIACGFTHFMEMVVLWKPLYWLAGDVKLLTAAASIVTAVALPPLVPKVHAMLQTAHISEHRREQLELANDSLQTEVSKRIKAEESLRVLSGNLLRLQDEERRRLARELHDSVGQLLTGAQLNLSAMQTKGTDLQPAMSSLLSNTRQLVSQVFQEIRTLSHLLHPPMLDEVGLASALRWYAEGFAERSGIRVDLDLADEERRFPRDVETTVFRIVQEGLINIHRHSGSLTAKVALRKSGSEINLEVADQGKGIPEIVASRSGVGPSAGVGLRGMGERVRQLNGRMEILSDSSETRIMVALPISEDMREGLESNLLTS